MTIHNDSAQPLLGWELTFDFAPGIGSIWDAQIVNHSGVHYTIDPQPYNTSIPAGGAVTFGFIGAPGNLTAGPSAIQVTSGGSVPVPVAPVQPPASSSITIHGVDAGATQITVEQSTTTYPLSAAGVAAPVFTVSTNNAAAIAVGLTDPVTLAIAGLSAGRASLRIEETTTHTVRYLGVRIRNRDGTALGLPSYLAVGSVSDDTAGNLGFWQQFAGGPVGRRMDIRYIYLNGGPLNGWDTWSGTSGDRATQYVRNSRTLGMIPFFVFYNIPDASEGYALDLAHAQDPAYMAAYFRNLALALKLINQESPDDVAGMILEPDFLGYLAQNAAASPSGIPAATHAVYDSGVLSTGADPAFPDTITGLVSAINYTISTRSPQVKFGWQINLWASPAGGWTVPIPSKGLMHLTETAGVAAGRPQIAAEATGIANYYVQAGILAYGASFVSIDKYGLDAVGFEASAAQNPAGSVWFWNNDLWQNYLAFVHAVSATTALPAILWQLPVGRINSSRAANPLDPSGAFPDLADTNQQYEDSAPDFFFGDTFACSGARYRYFSANLGADPQVSTDLYTVTWGAHMADAADNGVVAILFGAGVGASTNGVGAPPTDSDWWIVKAQEYFKQPVPLDPPRPRLARANHHPPKH